MFELESSNPCDLEKSCPLPVIAVSDAAECPRLPQSPPETPPESDQSWHPSSEVGLYRSGFNDACDGLEELPREYEPYYRGFDAGVIFRERISATREPLEGHFPGWPVDTRKFPKALRVYAYRGLRVPIRLPKFSHGGDRRSAHYADRPAIAGVDPAAGGLDSAHRDDCNHQHGQCQADA